MKPSDDQQYLQLLSIFHYVVAGMIGLFACLPIFHFTIGIALFIGGVTQRQESEALPMAFMGLLFAVIAGSIILFGWVLAVCIALAGRSLATKKRYMFCLVMAGIECAFTPFGTILGVFTIVVLVRPSVKELFMPQTLETVA